jgi:hypothetical protein
MLCQKEGCMKVLGCAAVLSLLLASAPVRGQEAAQRAVQPIAQASASEVEVGDALVCDTRQQVERIVSFMRGDLQRAVNAVNAAEHDRTACGMSRLAFVRGANLATLRTREETFQIVEILVVGVVTEAGVQAIVPNVQVSLVKVEEGRA